MASVEIIDVVFRFVRADGYTMDIDESFNPADSLLQSTVNDHAEELLSDLNEDSEEEWKFIEYEVVAWDGSWADPSDFVDLDVYGEYAENVERYGEAYHLRHEDVGSLDATSFEDSFEGTFEDEEEYARRYCDDCGLIPVHLERYFDYEQCGKDFLTNCSSYDGDEGLHVFRD